MLTDGFLDVPMSHALDRARPGIRTEKVGARIYIYILLLFFKIENNFLSFLEK